MYLRQKETIPGKELSTFRSERNGYQQREKELVSLNKFYHI